MRKKPKREDYLDEGYILSRLEVEFYKWIEEAVKEIKALKDLLLWCNIYVDKQKNSDEKESLLKELNKH